ncbi:MAG TPA: tetratricopeptide repeat protein, partial [Gemmataceae bacterium]|nr:tetratricopeptide repeat protein [Gemmataceae bacterium]
AEAGKLYAELARAYPDDTTIPIKLAELALWSEDYDAALARYQELLDKNADQPALWKGYVDAAASAKTLPEACRTTTIHVHQNAGSAASGDAVFLTRLAWVLRRVKELDRSIAALEKALALDPESRPIRLQLAEALYERGEHARAEQHFQLLLRARPSASK